MDEQCNTQGILLEAEQFADYGGWLLDSQFEREMGSAYLLAHGLGKPVADAYTTLTIPTDGQYEVWARTKDWVPGYHPGSFRLLVNGDALPEVLGADDLNWHWQSAGRINLTVGEHTIALHDSAGFDGRCDAVFLAPVGIIPPEEGLQVNLDWRKELLGIPASFVEGGTYDLVVVGGGVPAASAAIAAARTGSKTALICDRPVLGGNASREVGLGPRGYKTPIVEQMIERKPDSCLGCEAMVENEPNVDIFFNERVFACEMDGDSIVSVTSRNLISGIEKRYYGTCFVDASGRGALAKLSGADIRTGREGRSEFEESLAPDLPDSMHHGHTLLYHVGMADVPVEFPDIPWATEVSKDFACLAGQMGKLSEDNQPGPCKGEPTTALGAKTANAKAMAKIALSVKKDHMFPPEEVLKLFPGTHFWEYGQFLDLDEPGNEELVRDYIMRALYGTMANVKTAMPDRYANLQFEWLHHVPATGEYCRIMGDTIVTENDVRNHTEFPDKVVLNGDAFCLHYPGDENYDFRLKSWVYDMRDNKPYEIPFSSLYSRNIKNLMMAGKQISVSRVVGSSSKVMANGAQHGVAVGCAASLATQQNVSPREVGAHHLDELRNAIERVSSD